MVNIYVSRGNSTASSSDVPHPRSAEESEPLHVNKVKGQRGYPQQQMSNSECIDESGRGIPWLSRLLFVRERRRGTREC